jgi:GxxExxY protein
VAERVVVELKTVEKLLPVHEAQLLTYLRFSEMRLGLLLNFRATPIKSGIRRVVNDL